jgi:hypothetical protein
LSFFNYDNFHPLPPVGWQLNGYSGISRDFDGVVRCEQPSRQDRFWYFEKSSSLKEAVHTFKKTTVTGMSPQTSVFFYFKSLKSGPKPSIANGALSLGPAAGASICGMMLWMGCFSLHQHRMWKSAEVRNCMFSVW